MLSEFQYYGVGFADLRSESLVQAELLFGKQSREQNEVQKA
jgi:hypothetical protein